jgi:hypothetical protein
MWQQLTDKTQLYSSQRLRKRSMEGLDGITREYLVTQITDDHFIIEQHKRNDEHIEKENRMSLPYRIAYLQTYKFEVWIEGNFSNLQKGFNNMEAPAS